MASRHLFGDKQLAIVNYCAEEVRRQGDTPLHVAYMVQAWEHTWTQTVLKAKPLSVGLIEEIGAIVAPEHNSGGFRRYGVRVGASIKMPYENVPRAMVNLCEAWVEGRIDGFVHPIAGAVGPAEHLYYEFEDAIHPFGDGNGRVGKIIYNSIQGTLDDPLWPPMFWERGNP